MTGATERAGHYHTSLHFPMGVSGGRASGGAGQCFSGFQGFQGLGFPKGFPRHPRMSLGLRPARMTLSDVAMHSTGSTPNPGNPKSHKQPHLSLGVSPARMTLSDVAMHSTSSPLMYACGTFAAR